MLTFVKESIDDQRETAVFDRKQAHVKSGVFEKECAVLLKIDGILSLLKRKKTAFIGAFAESPRYQGAGSSHINVRHAVSALECLDGWEAVFAKGYDADQEDAGDPDSWADDVVFPGGGTDPVYISDWEWTFGIFETAMEALGITDSYCVSVRQDKVGMWVGVGGQLGGRMDMGDEYTSGIFLSEIKTDKYIVFGGSGCLNKEIAHGKVMVPTEGYRDEETSYHYAPASDYITIKNADVVARFMEENKIPFVKGKTWTTDSFYRETNNNFEKRKADGCISVEMECSAIQAMCDFRKLNLYMFLTCGDLLDAPKHLYRNGNGQYQGTQHDASHFEIALLLADYVTGTRKINEKLQIYLCEQSEKSVVYKRKTKNCCYKN